MKPQAGFTLIEVMITSIVSTILAGAILATFQMSNTNLKEGASYQRLSLIQQAVSGQIELMGRKGFTVQTEDVDGNFEDVGNGDLSSTAEKLNKKQVYFCDPDGVPFAAYKIDGEYLMELDRMEGNVPVFDNFRIGDVIVRVNPDSSYFDVMTLRMGVRYSLRFIDPTYPDDSFPLAKGAVICRNQTR